MANKEVTMEDLARMVKEGFDENTDQHQQIFDRLDKLEENQEKIIMDLENVVHQDQFEKLEQRVEKLEQTVLSIKKEK